MLAEPTWGLLSAWLVPCCGQKGKVHLRFQHGGTKKASFVCVWVIAISIHYHQWPRELRVSRKNHTKTSQRWEFERPIHIEVTSVSIIHVSWASTPGHDSSVRCPNRWYARRHFKRLECDEVVNIRKPLTNFFTIKFVDWNLSISYELRLFLGKKRTGAKAGWGRRWQSGPTKARATWSQSDKSLNLLLPSTETFTTTDVTMFLSVRWKKDVK